MAAPGTRRESSALRFDCADPTRPPARELLASMTDELNRIYATPDRLSVPVLSAEDLMPPHGAYLVARVGDRVVAGGGVRRLEEGVGEVKRMFVDPEHRGQGIARALLRALEDAGRRLGFGTLRLDTGPLQPGARRLYELAGYRPIERYNDNPYASFWGQKDLGATDPVPGADGGGRSENGRSAW